MHNLSVKFIINAHKYMVQPRQYPGNPWDIKYICTLTHARTNTLSPEARRFYGMFWSANVCKFGCLAS